MAKQSPRELVRRCLTFASPARVPRDMWTLPWALTHYPDEIEQIQRDFPNDIASPPDVYRPSPRVSGDPYAVGTYVDEWGCAFENLQAGVIGEVTAPQIPDLTRWQEVQPPDEVLPADAAAARDAVNRACAETDRFVLVNTHFARPWERYQFLRGTTDAMMDMALGQPEALKLLRVIHEHYLREMEFWVTTDVDGVMFMDDWGTQESLLIRPATWREVFKPLYTDYCQLAHAHEKFAFMHSDGCIAAVCEDLIEAGVDALNSQLFCMDLDDLQRRCAGRITFWGEIDRQHVLPSADPAVARDAVRRVAEHLYDPTGGVIAQFEFGPGANPAAARAVFEAWAEV